MPKMSSQDSIPLMSSSMVLISSLTSSNFFSILSWISPRVLPKSSIVAVMFSISGCRKRVSSSRTIMVSWQVNSTLSSKEPMLVEVCRTTIGCLVFSLRR